MILPLLSTYAIDVLAVCTYEVDPWWAGRSRSAIVNELRSEHSWTQGSLLLKGSNIFLTHEMECLLLRSFNLGWSIIALRLLLRLIFLTSDNRRQRYILLVFQLDVIRKEWLRTKPLLMDFLTVIGG